MARGWLQVCLVASLTLFDTINARAITAPPAYPTVARRYAPAATNIACGWASSASSSYVSAKPEATAVYIDAEIAHECLRSVPNYQEPALRLLNSLRAYLEFQSTKEILKNPPKGWLFPPLDIDYGMDAIQEKVKAGEYESEYAFQLDIVTLLGSARDGHLAWNGDLMSAFSFRRRANLAAISSDGEQLPQIYHLSDLIALDDDGQQYLPVEGYNPSPVVSIDGVDVVSFLLEQSLVSTWQDPDALWNNVFYQLSRSGSSTFLRPKYYPGPYTNITFANKTTRMYNNLASVNVLLDGVATGDDAYSVMCPGAVEPATATESLPASSTSEIETETATATAESTSLPYISGFPYPVIKHSADSVAGYYLNDTGLTDIAVLQVREFESDVDNSLDYESEFQSVVQKFLDAAVKSKKKKLIIDLQGNGGGYVDLGTDLFGQLFPSMPPNSKSDMRAHLGLEILGNAASDNVTAAEKTKDENDEDYAENQYVPLAFQTIVDPELRAFPNFEAVYGPFERDGGNYTAYFQNNYTDPNSSDFAGQGIIITGTNDRKDFRQPFAAQDIIVLYDGYCASTCTVFSEYLKSLAGVQFIAVGGRPQTGPMQAIGGVKGVQVFPFNGLIYPIWTDLFQSANNAFRHAINGTIWEYFNDEPVLRAGYGAVNGRNHYRIDEKTETALQFVYEAADCRIWWTHEMLYDPTSLWARVANIAFKERKGTQFNSKYCVKDSTGHATSISGGWKKGSLGPQDVPQNIRASVKGWKLGGDPLTLTSEGDLGDQLSNSTMTNSTMPSSPSTSNATESGNSKLSDGIDIEGNALVDSEVTSDDAELNSLKDACKGYQGDAWFVELICGALDRVTKRR